MKISKRQKMIIIPVAIAIAINVITHSMTTDVGIMGNVLIISLFIATVPYFIYKYLEFVWIKTIERQFPNFIRDLADSKRGGMSLSEAINITAKAHYGKLTPEVQRMSNRLSWGTPFLRVLEIFGKRVKASKMVTEGLSIIKESYESGGNIAATLNSVARDMRTLQEAEDDRRSMVKQHVLIMYGIFFIFLGVSVAIIFVMVPMMRAQPTAVAGPIAFEFRDPCGLTAGITTPAYIPPFPCGLFLGICSVFGVSAGISCYYIALFFCILMLQGLFSGLIAGQLGENSITAGTKHSLIMISAGVLIFLFLSKMGLLPI